MSLLSKGNVAFREKEFQKAIQLYESAIAENPDLKELIDINLSIAKDRLIPNTRDLKQDAFRINENLIESTKSKPTIRSEELSRTSIPKQAAKVYQTSVYEGRLEMFQDGMVVGWAVNRNNPSSIFDLDIYVDDVYFGKNKNSLSRADLKRHKKSAGKGGYKIVFPPEMFIGGSRRITLKWPTGDDFANFEMEAKYDKVNCFTPKLKNNRPISIIVPIYNAAEDVKTCIKRLQRFTSSDTDIILINDASTDKEVFEILEKSKQIKNIRIFHNESNLGFTRTVNKGIALAGTNDVVLLNSDARVTPRWLEGLRAAASIYPKVATVTPMSDRAGAFSAPKIGNDNDLPDGVSEENYAVAFRRASLGLYPTVPTGNGFCLYINRQCLNEIGTLDEEAFPRGYGEENDFCMRARSKGWLNIIDDRTYVFHDRNKSFGEAKTDLMAAGRKIIDERYPDYKKSTSVFTNNPLINLARYCALSAMKEAKSSILPRGLFVISTLTGGTPQTNRDLMLSVSKEVEPWLLHCDAKVMSLYKIRIGHDGELVERHVLSHEVDPLTHISHEYDQVLYSWLTKYDYEFVHIRHLAWHSLNLPKLGKLCGARVFNSFHDYYTVCPTVKLLDNERNFCSGNCTNTGGDCTPELWGGDAFPKLKDSWVYRWREKLEEALAPCDAFITTHLSAKDIILKHLKIDKKKFYVIPHGRDFKKIYQLAEPYKDGDVLKVLVPGNISEAKGSEIISSILNMDDKALIEFHILGRVSASLGQFKHPRLIIHGEYKRENFAEHVKKIKPHIGAVLSIWNETWCHTLTELWSVGLPVVVTEYQTLSQRVKESGAGWVLESTDLLKAYEIFTDIVPRDIVNKRQQILLKSAFENIANNTNNRMAENYLRVYFDRV
ncbi:glycosyltransferase [Alteromonas sp. H39]|uniref:glycosyltransferase n=1 Tax=Alteromonas sp. H39 TaxID=3389876 RepID=UPI0039E10578